MGIQSFFKQRRPRQFDHKPIYWDPKKEELAQRVARVRQEMIEAGEFPQEEASAESGPAETAETASSRDTAQQIRGSFVQATRHLKRQHKQGLTASERDQRMVRLMLALLALGLAFWYFFLR